MNEPALAVENLSVELIQDGRYVRVVDSISFSVDQGETLAIIGESGSGKTVTCRGVLGLLPQTARITGSARFHGVELLGIPEPELRRHRGSDLSMIFQDPARSLNPTMRIGDQIAEAIRVHTELTRSEVRARTIELLEMVRIPSARERYRNYPHQLSGGQRQRVMIAMALACEPKVMVADEATTALDVTTQAQIMQLLLELQERLDMAIVFISHNLALASMFADRTMVMYAGRVVERAPTSTLFGDVRMPYTEALLGALPDIDDDPHTLLPVVPGRPPDLSALPPGCPFAPRCPRRASDCVTHRPPLTEYEGEHAWACWHPLGARVGIGSGTTMTPIGG